MSFKKMFINVSKMGYSGIIPFVHVRKEEVHKYMQYDMKSIWQSIWAG